MNIQFGEIYNPFSSALPAVRVVRTYRNSAGERWVSLARLSMPGGRFELPRATFEREYTLAFNPAVKAAETRETHTAPKYRRNAQWVPTS